MSDPAPRFVRTDLAAAVLLGLAACLLLPQSLLGPESVSTVLATVAVIASFGLACWRVGRDRPAASSGFDPSPLVDRLDRIAAAIASHPVRDARLPTPADLPAYRVALAELRWVEAEAALVGLEPGDEATRLSAELANAKVRAAERVRDELTAAKGVNDPARAVELRDALVPLLSSESLREIDLDLVKWLLAAVMKRLRTGTVGEDVASLAATVADRFGHTTEGASLRASLPTLRRSAGLCPRCARPYRGIADACPACLKAARLAAQPAPPPVADLASPDEQDDPISSDPADPLDSPWGVGDRPD